MAEFGPEQAQIVVDEAVIGQPSDHPAIACIQLLQERRYALPNTPDVH